jgi:hypothetical protein
VAKKGWGKLSPAYRDRLKRQGITAQSYRTGDLRGARGHKAKPPPYAAPAVATQHVAIGQGTEAELSTLADWARSSARPSWIPKTMGMDAAAALSQIDLNPEQWGHVRFEPRPDGAPWEMYVTPRGAPLRSDGTSVYDRHVTIPGGGSPHSFGAREILDWLTYNEDMDYEIRGS